MKLAGPASGVDDLVNELLATNPAFRTMVEKSKSGPRKPFPGQNTRDPAGSCHEGAAATGVQ